MDFSQIKYEVDGHIATIILDRPDNLNAASPKWSPNSCKPLIVQTRKIRFGR